MLTRFHETLAYDAANRLVSDSYVDAYGTGDDSLTFAYDGDDRRVSRTLNGQTTVFVCELYEQNLATGEETKYYYAGSRRIASRKGGTLSYWQGDHLGSTTVLSDPAGNVVDQLGYFPWGGTRTD